MIENIGKSGYETLSEYCRDFVHLVKENKKQKGKVVIAEIGVGIGATAVEVIKYLDERDEYYMFDFSDVLEDINSDIKKLNQQIIIKLFGNSHRTYDTYGWNLAKLVLDMREKNQDGIFDVVYLDGARTLIHDGLTTLLLKELVKKEGYIIFDDVYWKMGTSPTISKDSELQDKYTDEQIEACHIELIIKLIFGKDDAYKQIYFTDNKKPWKATFQRLN